MEKFFGVKKTKWKPFIIMGWFFLCCIQAVLKIAETVKRRIWSYIWPGCFIFDYKKAARVIDVPRCDYAHIKATGTIPLELLRVRLRTPDGIKLRKIEETPHYVWIKSIVDGNEKEAHSQGYRDYIKIYEPNMDIEKRLNELRTLVAEISSSLDKFVSETGIIIYVPEITYRGDIVFFIHDGNHRAAIAKAHGLERIAVLFIA
ncbi:hypothetical protein [Geotalea uraniireducens]|uniref:Uncharacterized protein n=1 Tax=Geotalea uraniireducens (strain Rf4) TaxID=351605 RepID=A5GEM0_GEOUR|nr:hypothetical protein [Geotalea uraniireducens]ABQ25875.1 hypothetical protein Gura_1680 [Geotalea uraniireducens Rf4]